jgi:hypothetical protein
MNLNRKTRWVWAALALALVAGVPAYADFIPIAQPNAAYTSSAGLLPITAPDFFTISTLQNAQVTLNSNVPLVALTVPGTWTSWGSPPNVENATPRVLWTNGFTSLTLSTAALMGTFGLEAQPNTDVPSSITVDFFNNSILVGSITRLVDGNAGAQLFAASTTTTGFNRIVISSTDDFAIAQVRVRLVPEPGTFTNLIGAAVVGVVARLLSRLCSTRASRRAMTSP